MGSISFKSVRRAYAGTDRPAVDGLDLHIEEGEFMVLVGPSGCGKSTSLRMLAGLEPVDDGSISLSGRDITHLAPRERDIAMVFQNYALYPHMTVAENMGFALKLAKVGKTDRDARVLEAARMLDLEPYLGRKPKALSGGQRQRVAMGRAIVRHPQVFCMDEPLSNLDAKLRVSTRTQVAALQQRLGITTVYVTHDQVEAMTMGDRVAVMRDGMLQQVDTPLALYDRPANLFVATFMGSPAMNVVKATLVGSSAVFGGMEVPIDRGVAARASQDITLGLRPEALHVVDDKEPGLSVTVTLVEELGADAFLYGTTGLGDEARNVVVRIDARREVLRGSTVKVALDPSRVHVFDTATGDRLVA